MTGGQRWAVRSSDDAVACADATGALVLAWLCRLVGARSAERLLARVYIEVAGSEDIDEPGLLATAFRLARAEEDPELAVIDRALIELHSVRGRSAAEVAVPGGDPSIGRIVGGRSGTAGGAGATPGAAARHCGGDGVGGRCGSRRRRVGSQ